MVYKCNGVPALLTEKRHQLYELYCCLSFYWRFRSNPMP